MGILDAFLRNSQAVQQPWSPMAPQQQPQTMTGATPGGMNSPPPMQAPAFAQPLQFPQFGTPAAPQPGFRARLADMFNPNGENYLFNNPTFMNGLTLLGESQNGGDWGRAAQSISQNQTQQLQRTQLQRQNRREDAADAREQTQFGWQEGAQARLGEQMQRWQDAVNAEQDPQRRAMLQAIGPDGYAQFVTQEASIRAQQEEGQRNRDNDVRVAGIRSANDNTLGRYFQQMDAQQIGDLNQQAAQLQAVALPGLRNLRNTITQAGQALVGQPIDYNTRISLGRYFNGSSAERQTLEVWRAQVLGPALETLRGLGAMSEREMINAIESFSNPNMTLGAAMQLIDEKIATAERRVSSAQATSRFFSEAGGITGVRNAAGQDYATYLAQELGATPGAAASPETSVPRGGYPEPSAADIATLRGNTSAERRQFFDQTYGPGAAARVLGGRTQTPLQRHPRYRQGQ